MLKVFVVHGSRNQARFLAESNDWEFYDCSEGGVGTALRRLHCLSTAEGSRNAIVYGMPDVGYQMSVALGDKETIEVIVQNTAASCRTRKGLQEHLL